MTALRRSRPELTFLRPKPQQRAFCGGTYFSSPFVIRKSHSRHKIRATGAKTTKIGGGSAPQHRSITMQ